MKRVIVDLIRDEIGGHRLMGGNDVRLRLATITALRTGPQVLRPRMFNIAPTRCRNTPRFPCGILLAACIRICNWGTVEHVPKATYAE
jgi:hypothetical protein